MGKPAKIIAISTAPGADNNGPCTMLTALDENGSVWHITGDDPPTLVHQGAPEPPWAFVVFTVGFVCLVVGFLVGAS